MKNVSNNKKMEDVFREVYENKKWGLHTPTKTISGSGSIPIKSLPWYDFLTNFCAKNNIKSVVDLGCGDFVNSKYWLDEYTLNNQSIEYIGVDIYQPLIDQLKEMYTQSFITMNGFTDRDKLPTADILISKDVMQHWPNFAVMEFIDWVIECKYYKAIIICNTCMQSSDWDDTDYDGPTGRTGRGLDCEKFPLKKYPFQKVLEWDPTTRKRFKQISYLSLDSSIT